MGFEEVSQTAKSIILYKGKGRPATIPAEKIRLKAAAGLGPSAIAQELGISRMSLHRVLNPRSAA